MKIIKENSKEFQNYKKAIENNKIQNTGSKLDVMVEILKKNNIKLSNIN